MCCISDKIIRKGKGEGQNNLLLKKNSPAGECITKKM